MYKKIFSKTSSQYFNHFTGLGYEQYQSLRGGVYLSFCLIFFYLLTCFMNNNWFYQIIIPMSKTSIGNLPQNRFLNIEDISMSSIKGILLVIFLKIDSGEIRICAFCGLPKLETSFIIVIF